MTISSNPNFNKKYAYVNTITTQDILTTAMETEKYISEYEKSSTDGIYWDYDPEFEKTPKLEKVYADIVDKINTESNTVKISAEDLSLYSGAAGIAYYYLQLYKTTQENIYLEKAKKGANHVSKNWRKLVDAKSMILLPSFTKGLFFGIAGMGSVLLEFYKETNSDLYKQALNEMVDYYIETASVHEPKAAVEFYLGKSEQMPVGKYWSGAPVTGLDGGNVLFLLHTSVELGREDAKQCAIEVGDYFLSTGRDENGYKIYSGYAPESGFHMPNFEYGTAGTGYVFGVLYEITKEKRFLKAAKDCADYVMSIAVPQKSGSLIPYRVGIEDEETFYYLSFCHGPVGTSRTFYQLYKLTQDVKYLDFIEELVKGMESLGVPNYQSTGLWNNTSYCCGLSGILQMFISVYAATGKEKYRILALETAKVLLGEKKMNDKNESYWEIAWTRVEPSDTDDPIGYYHGAAGIAATLLQLFQVETNSLNRNILVDDPFPRVLQ